MNDIVWFIIGMSGSWVGGVMTGWGLYYHFGSK